MPRNSITKVVQAVLFEIAWRRRVFCHLRLHESKQTFVGDLWWQTVCIRLERIASVASVSEYQALPLDEQRFLIEPRQHAGTPSVIAEMKQVSGVIKTPGSFDSRGREASGKRGPFVHSMFYPQRFELQGCTHARQPSTDHDNRAVTC